MRRPRFALRGLVLLAAPAVLALFAACVADDPILDVTAPPSDGGGSTPDDAGGPPQGEQDGGAGDGGDAATRFCQTQKAALGVADFFCADFDGVSPDEGFTTVLVPDGGKLARVEDLFYSAPAAVTTSGNAFLEWTANGAQPVNEVELRVRLNVGTVGGAVPPSTSTIQLFEIATVDTKIRFSYSRGANVDGQSYTGYFLEASSCPSACAYVATVIPNAPPLNIWTDVRLVWSKSGATSVAYNDVVVLSTTGFSSTSTKASAKLGLVGFGDVPDLGRHVFDNMIVNVRRE